MFTSFVFSWFVSLSTVGGFFSWFSMNLTYFYFCESYSFTHPQYNMLKFLRSRFEGTGFRSHKALVFQSSSALALILGNVLDCPVHLD